MKPFLIAHSDPEISQTLETFLVSNGLDVVKAANGRNALDILEANSVANIFAEIDLPGFGGQELIKWAQSDNPMAKVVLVSSDNSARTAMEAVRAGAFDYLATPVDHFEMAGVIQRLLDSSPVESHMVTPLNPADRYQHIIGQSKAIHDVFKLVDKVAKSDSTVMIYGESGTGKELIARAIHENSHRRNKPLIPVNCGAIPEELLESELFGHEKGSFTSAIRTRIGRFELSDSGTIFLDEIADMSPKLQVKILRVLQEHKIERIGGTKTIDVDIRVITATNKNLRQAMEANRFREDLFYRLNVIPLTVPPLRERRADIPALVNHFLNKFRQSRGSVVKGLAPETMEKLLQYSWPGNIRELENIVERMVILAETDVLTLDDLPSRISGITNAAPPTQFDLPEDGIDFNAVISDFENKLLLQALEKSNWVKNKAAKLLKLNRTTLVEKLKKKDLHPPR
jgi:DNA-binding NtrC family response regulator